MKIRSIQRGFTIIELLIASLVFSIFLLIVTSMIIQISHTYYKGIIASKTQETARSITANISQAIQFGGGVGISYDNTGYICTGSARFRFKLGQQVVDSGSPAADQGFHALVLDQGTCPPPFGGGISAVPQALAADVQELVPTKMRLAKLNITPVAGTNLYTITVRVVYGDLDLVCSPSVVGDCTSTATTTSGINDDLTCKQLAGSQFCAASELTTTVEKRV